MRSNFALQVVERFHRIYIGDSLISRIEIDIGKQQCRFWLDFALLLKEVAGASIFDPQQRYEPACLIFKGVRSISCIEGGYYLNSTIIGFDTVLLEGEIVQFRLKTTGADSNETFMRTLAIDAADFSLEAELC